MIEPQPAPVRPRVSCPESGIELPLEEVVRSCLEAGLSRTIQLQGDADSAPTALRHLAHVFAGTPEVRLTKADLRGARLAGAALAGAALAGADLSGAILIGAKLPAVNLKESRCVAAKFAQEDLSGCDLEGLELPAADFTDANLTGALLTGTAIPDGQLDGACLRNAGLADVDWERASLRGADLRGASFHLGSSRSGRVAVPLPARGARPASTPTTTTSRTSSRRRKFARPISVSPTCAERSWRTWIFTSSISAERSLTRNKKNMFAAVGRF